MTTIKPIEWKEDAHRSAWIYDSPFFKAKISERDGWLLEYEYGDIFVWHKFDELEFDLATEYANKALQKLLSNYLT